MRVQVRTMWLALGLIAGLAGCSDDGSGKDAGGIRDAIALPDAALRDGAGLEYAGHLHAE